MSAKGTTTIARNVEDVWRNISILSFFAKLFAGVSQVESVQGYNTDQRIQASGNIANSKFSSIYWVESINDKEKKVSYRSGDTVYEIDIHEDGDNTTLNLIIHSQMQDLILLDLFAGAIAKKIKNRIEGA